MSKQILLVDNHEIIRIGLRRIVEGSDIQIAAEASNAEEALQAFSLGSFDLVVVDYRLPGPDGFRLVNDLKQHKATQNILLFSSEENPHCIGKAVAIGVNGYVSKSERSDRIMDAIRRACGGEKLWGKEELKHSCGSRNGDASGNHSVAPLTQREGEVLEKLAHGMTNKEIAQSLGISYETVKEHVQHILRKVGVTDRTQAAVWAVRNQLV